MVYYIISQYTTLIHYGTYDTAHAVACGLGQGHIWHIEKRGGFQ